MNLQAHNKFGNNITRRYKKYYTMKEWKNFDISIQMALTNRYQVFLKDYKTREEKNKILEKKIIDFINLEWLRKKSKVGQKKKNSLDTLLTKFSKGMKQLDGSNFKLFPEMDRKNYDAMIKRNLGLGEQKNYSDMIWGKPQKKHRGLRNTSSAGYSSRDVRKAVWG